MFSAEMLGGPRWYSSSDRPGPADESADGSVGECSNALAIGQNKVLRAPYSRLDDSPSGLCTQPVLTDDDACRKLTNNHHSPLSLSDWTQLSAPIDYNSLRDQILFQEEPVCQYVCPQQIELNQVEHEAFFTGFPSFSPINSALGRDRESHTARLTHCEQEQTCTAELSPGLSLPEYTADSDIHQEHQRPHHQTGPVKDWFLENASWPYASEDQIQDLAAASNLTKHQVRVCLSNLRSRMICRDEEDNQADTKDGLGHHHFALATPTFGTVSMMPNLTRTNFEDLSIGSTKDYTWPSIIGHPSYDPRPQLRSIDLSDPSSSNCGGAGTARIYETIDTPVASLLQPPTTHATKVRKRKGKRHYVSRYAHHTSRSSDSTTSTSSAVATPATPNTYYCTVCPKAFKDAHGWRRHEAAVHNFHTVEWICMREGHIVEGVSCAFCSELFPDDVHIEQHGIHNCLHRSMRERTFFREDHLKQHILQVHIPDMERSERRSFKVPATWGRNVNANDSDPRSLWCGFCQASLDTTATWMDHVAEHFRSGADMSFWTPRPG